MNEFVLIIITTLASFDGVSVDTIKVDNFRSMIICKAAAKHLQSSSTTITRMNGNHLRTVISVKASCIKRT